MSLKPLLSSENGEAIQILHYENGQKYEPHFDFFHDKANQQMGGHRVATVLMYLSHVEIGGETIFPNSEVRSSSEFHPLTVPFYKRSQSPRLNKEKEIVIHVFVFCRQSRPSQRMTVGLNVLTEATQV